MASESVATETNETERGPKALSGFDSSVFSAWAAAVADLMACGGASHADAATVPDAGGLIYSLVQAAEELTAAENAARRARA